MRPRWNAPQQHLGPSRVDRDRLTDGEGKSAGKPLKSPAGLNQPTPKYRLPLRARPHFSPGFPADQLLDRGQSQCETDASKRLSWLGRPSHPLQRSLR